MMSCLWNGIAFAATLRTYTLGPLIILCMLGMPVGAAHFRRLHIIARGRYRETVDRFWTNSMFVAFALYPALAMTSMSVLNCDPNVGRLRDDYRVVCPNAMDPLSVYSYCFMLLYCLGIPVVMHVALRVAGIQKVVQSKIQAAEFQAMMGLFMKLYVSVELARFARLVGNVDDDEVVFAGEAKREFNKLLAVQGDGADELDLKKLGKAAAGTQAIGMEGTSLTSIVKCLGEYDTNGDGKTDFEEFCGMLRDARARANLFTGAEDAELNDKQLTALLTFDKWPSKSSGPGDIGESEGMGGLLAVANQGHGQAADDVEERAGRQQNIEEGGDRSDPELVAIDAFKEEMEKREVANCDLESPPNEATFRSPEEDWRSDIKKAEQLYVQNPAKVDDDFLERMRVKYLSTEAKKEKLAELAHQLVLDRITAIPAQVLLDSDPCSEISCWLILRCI